MMENRSGLAVVAQVTPATGTVERDFALGVAHAIPGRHERITLGGAKLYDTHALRGRAADGARDAACGPERDRPALERDRRGTTRDPGTP